MRILDILKKLNLNISLKLGERSSVLVGAAVPEQGLNGSVCVSQGENGNTHIDLSMKQKDNDIISLKK